MLGNAVLAACSFAFLHAVSAYAQGDAPAPHLTKIQELVKMQEAWDNPTTATPMARLRIKEVSRTDRAVKVRLVASGLRTDAVYAILTWPITRLTPSESLSGVTLDSSGQAICAGRPGTCGTPNTPDDPIDFTLPTAAGEPVRFGLISEDGANRAFVTFIAFPLRGEDRGCAAEAMLLAPGAQMVKIVGSGFDVNGEVTMESSSGNEQGKSVLKANTDGRLLSLLMPYTQGLDRGILRVDLKAAKCSPSVKVPWARLKTQ